MPLHDQVTRLVQLGVPELAGMNDERFIELANGLPGSLDERDSPTLVVHPALVPADRLTTVLRHAGKPGFVVHDMTDLADFSDVDGVDVPDRPLYLVRGIDRGDDLRNWSPNEALPEIAGRGRSPLTVNEGISWLLHEPEQLVKNHCFMTIGSRKRKSSSLDARTPAIWISGGTGHDGRDNRDAPKVGWCWAGNRHTWLGFASAAGRAG